MSKTKAYLLGFLFLIFAGFSGVQLGSAEALSSHFVWELRVPRLLLAFALGAGLSVAGVVLQALFSNPLCEPHTLGITSGAALGAVLGTAFGWSFHFSGIAGSAFVGALIFTGIIYLLSRQKGISQLGIVLSGVMLGLVGSSLLAVWMAIGDARGIQGAISWLLGDLSRAELSGALASIVLVSLSIFLIWRRSRSLDGMLLGEETAISLGIDLSRERSVLLLFSALLIGVCVSAGGAIGFIGLIIPHFVRRWIGALHTHLIPLSALWGAAVLGFAETLSRTVYSPLEIPIGVVTALVGAPCFMFLLLRQKGTSS